MKLDYDNCPRNIHTGLFPHHTRHSKDAQGRRRFPSGVLNGGQGTSPSRIGKDGDARGCRRLANGRWVGVFRRGQRPFTGPFRIGKDSDARRRLARRRRFWRNPLPQRSVDNLRYCVGRVLNAVRGVAVDFRRPTYHSSRHCA
jgi:hypothetical protein